MGRPVVRKDQPHRLDQGPDRCGASLPSFELDETLIACVARLLGDTLEVRLIGPAMTADALERGLRDLGCEAFVARTPTDAEPGSADALVLIEDPVRLSDLGERLHDLRGQLASGGSLILIVNRLDTDAGLIGRVEAAGLLVGRIERLAGTQGAVLLVVAYLLPEPGAGLDRIQRLWRELATRAETSERRLELLAAHQQRLNERVDTLRTRLLEAHAELVRRDDEIYKTFGDAIALRNALLIERDGLLIERATLCSLSATPWLVDSTPRKAA